MKHLKAHLDEIFLRVQQKASLIERHNKVQLHSICILINFLVISYHFSYNIVVDQKFTTKCCCSYFIYCGMYKLVCVFQTKDDHGRHGRQKLLHQYIIYLYVLVFFSLLHKPEQHIFWLPQQCFLQLHAGHFGIMLHLIIYFKLRIFISYVVACISQLCQFSVCFLLVSFFIPHYESWQQVSRVPDVLLRHHFGKVVTFIKFSKESFCSSVVILTQGLQKRSQLLELPKKIRVWRTLYMNEKTRG